jgi:trans-aconitate methyltransferase
MKSIGDRLRHALTYAIPVAVICLGGTARGELLMLSPARERALDPPSLIARLRLAPDAVVADIGAGPGLFTLPLARALPRGRVIATDVDHAMLAETARRAQVADLANVEIRRVAPDQPGLRPHEIDLAFLCQVDPYLPDRAAYLKALLPALRGRGRIVFVNFHRFREADTRAAQAAGLRVVDEWDVGSLYFAMVTQCDTCGR